MVILESILPKNYRNNISSFKIIKESKIQNETKFEATMAVNICSKEGMVQFLDE